MLACRVSIDYCYNLYDKHGFRLYILKIPHHIRVVFCVFMLYLVILCTVTMQPVVSCSILCVYVVFRAVSVVAYLDQQVSDGALAGIQ